MVDFPTRPFYLLWKQGLSDYVLAPAQSDGTALRLKVQHRTGAPEQLWNAIPDARGGYLLANLGDLGDVFGTTTVPLVLTLTNPVHRNAGAAIEKFNPASNLQLFGVQSMGTDPWVRVESTSSFDSQIFVGREFLMHAFLVPEYGDANNNVVFFVGTAVEDNQLWNPVPELGDLTYKSITYDLKQATSNPGIAPKYFADDEIVNNTDFPLQGSHAFSWQTSKSRTLTNSDSQTSGSTFTQTFGIKGGVKDVVEVSETSTYSVTQSETEVHTDATTATETRTETTTVQYNVPARKTYQYIVKESSGQVSVPYTAIAVFKSSIQGIKPRTITITGIFEGVNVVNTEIMAKDITDPDPEKHSIVDQRRAIHHRAPKQAQGEAERAGA